MEAFFVSQAAIEICATLEQKQHKVNQQKGEKKRDFRRLSHFYQKASSY